MLYSPSTQVDGPRCRDQTLESLYFESLNGFDFELPSNATACAAEYECCGGKSCAGPFCCQPGDECVERNEWFSQCLPSPDARDDTGLGETAGDFYFGGSGELPPTPPLAPPPFPHGLCVGRWQTCGGKGYVGPTSCCAGTQCAVQNAFSSLCEPGAHIDSTSELSSACMSDELRSQVIARGCH